MRDEFVKVLPANDAIQVVQEVESLFVRYLTVDIFRVHILVADDQLGVLVILAEELDGVLCHQ